MKNEFDQNVLLSIRDLTVEYTSEGNVIHAVNHVSMDLKKGKTLGLVGETGAGKTTMAKSILRILPRPQAKIQSGSVCFKGQDLLQLDHKTMQEIRGSDISMIFQDPMTALNPIVRVGDQIAEAIKIHEHVSYVESKKKTEEMLEMVGISAGRYREYPHQFSGGMKQRVIIAMALACNPALILADEPTTALDVTIQAQILDMMSDLKTRNNTAMILITHDLGVVAEICDDVNIMYAGEIVESGTKEQIFLNPSHPYTLGLFASLPDLESDMARLSSIRGLPPDPSNLPAGCAFHPRCPYADASCSDDKINFYEIEDGHISRCKKIHNVKEENVYGRAA